MHQKEEEKYPREKLFLVRAASKSMDSFQVRGLMEASFKQVAQRLINLTRNHEVLGSIPDLLIGLRIQRCHELRCRSQMQLRSCVAMAVV